MGQGKHSGFLEPDQRNSWLWKLQSPPKHNRDFSWCRRYCRVEQDVTSPNILCFASTRQSPEQDWEGFSHRAKSLLMHNIQESQGHGLEVMDAETLQHPLSLQSWKCVEQPEGCWLSACTILQP